MRKPIHPTVRFALDSTNPLVQQMVIDLFRKEGIRVYERTTEYDPEYPVLFWDGLDLCQTDKWSTGNPICSLEDFIAQFYPPYETVQIGSYSITVDSGDAIKAGCQTISFEEVEKVYLAMKDLRK